MGERVWDEFLTDRDKQVFDAAGYAQPAGLGERPAVIVIDVNYHFTGDKNEPILESIKKWPNSCGRRLDSIAAHQTTIRCCSNKGASSHLHNCCVSR